MNKIKEYMEYKRNKKIVKKEFTKIATTTLPIINELSVKGIDIIKFVIKLVNVTQEVDGERFLELILKEVSTVLQTDNSRIIEILTYMANLSSEDIQKILVHSVVDTMPSNDQIK